MWYTSTYSPGVVDENNNPMRKFVATKGCAFLRRGAHRNQSALAVGVYSSHSNDTGFAQKAAMMLGALGTASLASIEFDDDDGFTRATKTLCDGKPHQLTSHSVADAIEMVAPSVVNIMSNVDGILVSGISSGSGFIITEDGFIVTNAHVVSSSSNGKVLITSMTGIKRIGTVHSMDAQSDIALIKIDKLYKNEKLPIVTMGSSKNIRPGDFVVALGSPIQLQNSASFGIVSAATRHASELGMSNNRSEYIQTDAAINQGNSGGPLINLAGEIIGINVMKAKGADGISFAIPVDTASNVIKQLMAQKRVIRPYVGLTLTNFIVHDKSTSSTSEASPAPRLWWSFLRASDEKKRASDLRARLYYTQNVLVIVEAVKAGSPAEHCGIKVGDFIIAVDDKPITGVRDVLDAVGMDVGKTVKIQLRRRREFITVYLTSVPEDER